MSRKAVQFGAGNIGRGFLGQLFYESGYETTFVDVVAPLVHALQTRASYPLRIVGEQTKTVSIGNVTALNASDIEAVATALAESDVAATAVGVNVLPKVAPLIAAGIVRRFGYPDAPELNVIVCENMLQAGAFLRKEVQQHLPEKLHEVLHAHVGFIDASIGRMAPTMTAEQRAEDPLLVCVEPYCELPVDATGFKGPIPALEHMAPRENFGAYVERKLFVHNAGHATAAYLGYLQGHEYTWQAIKDLDVLRETDKAMAETCEGLVAKWGLNRRELQAHWEDLKGRFANRALGDQVARVAKDPIRKLGPQDRLIGAGRMCLGQGIEPVHVAFAAAAAIRYDHPEDVAASSLQQIVRDEGLPGVFKRVCQIPLDSPLARLIAEQSKRLEAEGWVK